MSATIAAKPYIVCGMYNFGPATEQAWRALFKPFGEIYFDTHTGMDDVALRFHSADEDYLSLQMLLGHTCGYPLIKKWQHSHRPVSVPVFDIPGCTGHCYSSWFISHHGLRHNQLSEFAGTDVAVNDFQSNSGMNVLRYGLSDLVTPGQERFFESVIETGSHHNSITAVANQQADLASIDAVSYYHLIRLYPALAKQTRIIDQSVSTPGLPFMVHKTPSPAHRNNSSDSITDALNQCLERLDQSSRNLLRIARFDPVETATYQPLEMLEASAKQRGYGEIR